MRKFCLTLLLSILVMIQGLFATESECESQDSTMLCSTQEFFHHYGCVELFSRPRPIPQESTYRLLQEAYNATVGVEQSTIGWRQGFFPNVEVRYAEEAGRGVFALQKILKGEPVYTSVVGAKTARFRTAHAFRQFLRKVNNEWVCDLLVWCYPYLEDENNPDSAMVMACDLDEGSLTNDEYEYDPAFADDDQGTKNIGCDEDAARNHDGGCKHTHFALEDIEVGDEIIAAYSDFSGEITQKWFHSPWVGEQGVVTYY